MIHLNKAKEYTGINANSAGGMTGEFDVTNISTLSVFIIGATGAHTTHVFEIMVSGMKEDGSALKFMSVPTGSVTITGEGCISLDVTGIAKARIDLTTLEGAASTVDILINTFHVHN